MWFSKRRKMSQPLSEAQKRHLIRRYNVLKRKRTHVEKRIAYRSQQAAALQHDLARKRKLRDVEDLREQLQGIVKEIQQMRNNHPDIPDFRL